MVLQSDEILSSLTQVLKSNKSYMMEDFEAYLATKEEKYLNTIKTLRLKNFSNNLPFLMLSENLSNGQSYLEFPDGSIIIQKVLYKDTAIRNTIIRSLTPKEADQIRKEYGLY